MTKIDFTNVCNGTVLRNTESGLHYRLRERICRTLVLVRISPVASAQLVEVVKPSQRKDWEIAAQ